MNQEDREFYENGRREAHEIAGLIYEILTGPTPENKQEVEHE